MRKPFQNRKTNGFLQNEINRNEKIIYKTDTWTAYLKIKI